MVLTWVMWKGRIGMASIQGKQKTPQESLVGKTLCDDEYYIQRIIGHGGMGKVYLAAHSELKVPVAIKQARADQPLPESVTAELDYILQGGDTNRHVSDGLAQDFPSSGGVHTDRFLREALFLARLQHPALPSLYDYFFEDGYWYLVMDYIPGPTITTYLRQQGPLPPLEALNYAMQLCDVFDYLHKQSPPIIFRDLKPSNVIITPDGALMLVDFGIARYFKNGQNNDTTDFGSPGYASPEQYQAEGQTDGRSDLFSLGVLLHEMITGERPMAPGGIVPATRDSSRQTHPNLSAALSGLITLAMRTEPMYRFQSAHTFYLALERTYSIEERRTYQQRVMLEQAMEQNDADKKTEISTNAQDARAGDQSVPPIVSSLAPAQRRQIREVLQQMRRERLEEEELETQLTSVDESLKQRVSMPLSLSSQPTMEEPEEPFSARPSRNNAHRFIRTSFIVVLIIFLVLASLLTVTRFTRHTHTPTQGQQPRATPPGSTATASGPDVVNGSWQILPSLPSTEADNTAAYVQVQGREYIYVGGGYRGPKVSPHYDRHLYRYDIATAHWETSSGSQFPGMVNNAVAVDEAGHLFYTVGYSTDTYTVTSLLYMYQPSNGVLQKIVPPPQVNIGFGGSSIADGQGHLYISQGFTKSGDAHAQAGTGWYRYDIATKQWHVLNPLPVGLGYVVLAPDGNNGVILIGGATDAGQQQQTSVIYRYDTAANTWKRIPSNAPLTLSGAASCATQPGQIVVVGGYDVAHDKGLDQAWIVDLHTFKWLPLAHLPTGGSVLGAAASDGKSHVFLARGASDPSRPTPDFWELTV